MTKIELQCANVPGGWQTCIKGTEVRFGPVFNCITDLWVRQKHNIFTPLKSAEFA